MEVTPNPQLYRYTMDRLVESYVKDKPFPHLTELIYCLTRSYLDRLEHLPPTDDELLKFAIGWGLESVMVKGLETKPTIEDGIHVSPDFFHVAGPGEFGEFKTTRMFPPKGADLPRIPETWLEQIMGYCYAYGTLTYDLAILHIIPPELKCWRLHFNPDEVRGNWTHIMARKKLYLDFMALAEVPAPFEYNRDWECKGCRYYLRCCALKRGVVSGELNDSGDSGAEQDSQDDPGVELPEEVGCV